MSLYAIDRNRGLAVYKQIQHLLQEEIRTRYVGGDVLPSEQELSDRFGVNRHTLRRAVDELVSLGLLERRHGKGTFVLEPMNYPIHSGTRFTEWLSSSGRDAHTRVLRKHLVPASDGVARRLGIEEGRLVIWIETLRSVDSRPFCISAHFFCKDGFEPVLQGYSGGSLHHFLSESLGIELRRIESLITVVTPQGDDAILLRMNPSQPLLRTKSVNVDVRTGRPVEYTVTRFRGDRVELCVEMSD